MIPRRRYLVTGTQGQVAQSLAARAASRNDIEIIAVGRPELDLADTGSIAATVEQVAPELIISAAAYTAVDQAQSEEALAFAINADGPAALAQAAARRGIPLVHLSTDYVFSGAKTTPYVETDETGPTNVYGRSKLEGEQRVLSASPNVAVLRTAWVYSPYGKNFLKTMLRLAGERPELRVVADQFGNPTSALDIADAVLKVADNLLESRDERMRGVFHMTATGEASWADFARAIFAASAAEGGPSSEVVSISSSDYPTPASRPANSRLDCSKLRLSHGVVLPDWHGSTAAIVREILAGRHG
ncbi:dTDP-4-dehydrorhamnose reductase [Rhizobium aquaticum]|uniref:dTDP-4-dehydrorhamnose reductase n=1 Tax=Rhizobium aquaticum TaxID=1549636 RepID=A0ABV2J0W8_9HYPH